MTCTVEATKNSVRRLTSPVEGHVPPHILSRGGPGHSFTWVTRLSDSDSDDSAHFDRPGQQVVLSYLDSSTV